MGVELGGVLFEEALRRFCCSWGGERGRRILGNFGGRCLGRMPRRALAERAREMKTVRIIVQLRVPFVPEGELKSTWQVFRQREALPRPRTGAGTPRGAGMRDGVRTAKRVETRPRWGSRSMKRVWKPSGRIPTCRASRRTRWGLPE